MEPMWNASQMALMFTVGLAIGVLVTFLVMDWQRRMDRKP
jgi:hypothetical protein